ncbi:MAG: hypothetical protein Q8M65_04445, partial [Rhodoglobus sp.]|nr:hypothetical protein [Rhodoglobus sp.]
RARGWLRSLLGQREPVGSTTAAARAAAEFDRLRTQDGRRAAAYYDARIRPYPGRVILFRALDRDETAGWTDDGANGWRQVVSGTLTVIDLPGNHLEILQPPVVDVVAQHLSAALLDSYREPDAGAGTA